MWKVEHFTGRCLADSARKMADWLEKNIKPGDEDRVLVVQCTPDDAGPGSPWQAEILWMPPKGC